MRASGLQRSADPERADPQVPPFLPGRWTPLTADLTEALRQRAAAAGAVDAADRIESVHVRPLPFFPGWMLCDLLLGEVGTVQDSERAVLAVLYGPDGFTSLETPRAVARHIEAHGISLARPEDCLLYAQFAVAVGALGGGWRLAPPGDPGPTVEMSDGATPSVLDAVRAPEVARVRLRALDGEVAHSLTIRVASDGETTLLETEALDEPPQPEAHPNGPLRVVPKRKDGGE